MDVNVKVAIRCRPMSSKEMGLQCKSIITMESKTVRVASVDEHREARDFTFDHCYFTDSSQDMPFRDIGGPLITSALDGFNGTIFAYGQTGSGKSHTMMGGKDELRGIIPRLNDELWEKLKIAQEKADEVSTEHTKYLCTVSFLEIYNEEVKDLLNPSSKTLNIREHPQLGIYVENLCELIVRDSNGLMKLIDQGNAVRRVAATNMNDQSSRSHSCFTIKLERKITTELGNGVTREKSTRAKINLVDLAGSERQGKTGATGDTLKEGASINMSLMALGNCINALSESGKSGQKHIPYRDSKLTRLLQESLGGNARTVMIAAISPADYNYDETVSTLKYANRAKSIANAVVRNEDQTDKMIRNLKEQIEALKKQLETGGGPSGAGSAELQDKLVDMERKQKNDWEEKQRLQEELEAERQHNLNSAISDIMNHVKEEKVTHMKAIKRLGDEKNKVNSVMKESKSAKDRLKISLDASMHRYTELQKSLEDLTKSLDANPVPEGGVTSDDQVQLQRQVEKVSTEITLLLLEIETSRTNWVHMRDEYKNAKEKMSIIDKDIEAERVELVTSSTILQQNDRIRSQIQEEERMKAKDIIAEEIDIRTKEIHENVSEAFKNRIIELGAKLSEQNQVNISLESQVSSLTAEVDSYISRVASSEVDYENALKEIEKLGDINAQNEGKIAALRTELEDKTKQHEVLLEQRSLSHKAEIEAIIKAEKERTDAEKFDMFKSLCDSFEEERIQMELRNNETKKLLNDAAKDVMFLAKRNEELKKNLSQALQWEPSMNMKR